MNSDEGSCCLDFRHCLDRPSPPPPVSACCSRSSALSSFIIGGGRRTAADVSPPSFSPCNERKNKRMQKFGRGNIGMIRWDHFNRGCKSICWSQGTGSLFSAAMRFMT